jgi:hypothetical protein
MVKPEIQAEVERIMAGFRLECLRVLDETARLRNTLPEPSEGWREYFTRRIYTAFLKYKEDVEAVVEAHLIAQERA